MSTASRNALRFHFISGLPPLIYQYIGEAPFAHDFNNVQCAAAASMRGPVSPGSTGCAPCGAPSCRRTRDSVGCAANVITVKEKG